MKSEWLEITLEVPAEAVDFSDCGDGCGEVYGLRCAKVKVGTRYGTEMLPVLEFADGPLATRMMHEALGKRFEVVELPEEDKRTLEEMAEYSRRLRQEQREQHSAMVLLEREAEMNGILSKRRA